MKSLDNMRVSLFLCFFAALTQGQRNGPERRFDFKAREQKPDGTVNEIVFQTMSAVEKQIADLAQQPQLLTGSKNRKTVKEAKDTAVQAKKLFAKTQKKLSADVKKIKEKCKKQINKVVKKLGAIGNNLDTKDLSNGEAKLLNRVMVEGIAVEAMKLTGDVQDHLMKTLDRENAPMAAKVLVAQVMSQKLTDDTKKEIKKLVNAKQGPDDDVGVSDADDDTGDGPVVTDGDEAYADGVEPDNSNYVQGSGVDDEATLTDDSGPQKMQGEGQGFGYGSKKQMCLFTPRNSPYCVSQEKSL
ncbi:uncharacterized protein LOC125237106 isoform X2 [Leguminivora glycinivorella]|uniref:uncharacterized protein LOC125237106 isoform X2 n=1 Tax=Leguminivora glycinivorella TaxID=1035111 RepID=UPI00200EB3E5|nr:uncharacterized protein LOC125237106 isoform X2 [Leguminivora glycinivorella]